MSIPKLPTIYILTWLMVDHTYPSLPKTPRLALLTQSTLFTISALLNPLALLTQSTLFTPIPVGPIHPIHPRSPRQRLPGGVRRHDAVDDDKRPDAGIHQPRAVCLRLAEAARPDVEVDGEDADGRTDEDDRPQPDEGRPAARHRDVEGRRQADAGCVQLVGADGEADGRCGQRHEDGVEVRGQDRHRAEDGQDEEAEVAQQGDAMRTETVNHRHTSQTRRQVVLQKFFFFA